MAVQKTKSEILEELLDLSEESRESALIEPKESNHGNLPANVNGIAQLKGMNFSKDDKGNIKYYGYGVVVEPKEFEGMRTNHWITIYMDGSKESKLKSIASIQDDFKRLYPIDDPDQKQEMFAVENLASTSDILIDAAPYFKFRTWAGNKEILRQHTDGKWYVFNCPLNPDGVSWNEDRAKILPEKGSWKTETQAKGDDGNKYNSSVNGRDPNILHMWLKIVNYEGGNTTPDVQDNIEDNETNGEAPPKNRLSNKPSLPKPGTKFVTPPKTAPGAKPSLKTSPTPTKKPVSAAKPPEKKTPPKPSPKLPKEEVKKEFSEWSDVELLDMYGPQADAGDEDASLWIQEKAAELGVEQEGYNTWSELAEVLKGHLSGTSSETEEETSEGKEQEEITEEESQEWTPKIEDTYWFKPKGKDGKLVAKAIEGQILEADTEKQTVKIKELDTGKVFAGIPWDRLKEKRF